MELILLSIFGIGSLFAFELCSLFYKHLIREPYLTNSDLHDATPSANQTDPPAASQFLRCLEAANDADTTTIVRIRSRGTKHETTGE
jgi:hypothetical protein